MTRSLSGTIIAASLLALSGCDANQFGAQLTARPRPSVIRTPAGTTFRLPQDEPFALALPQETSAAGLDGTADSDAHAEPTGHASAKARVARAGAAAAIFQLGHAFANETERQLDLECTVRFRYRFVVSQEPRASLPDAAAGLRLYARERRGRMLRELSLLDYSTVSGPASRESSESLNFTLTLSPGEVVTLFLACQAKADVPADRTAEAELQLDDLEFHVVTHAAPEVPVAPAPTGAPPAATP